MPGGREVVTERFFNDDADPLAAVRRWFAESGLTDLGDNGFVLFRGYSQVEKAIAGSASIFIQLVEALFESHIPLWLIKLSLLIAHYRSESIPLLAVGRHVGCKL